jgi:hypothetical protein
MHCLCIERRNKGIGDINEIKYLPFEAVTGTNITYVIFLMNSSFTNIKVKKSLTHPVPY